MSRGVTPEVKVCARARGFVNKVVGRLLDGLFARLRFAISICYIIHKAQRIIIASRGRRGVYHVVSTSRDPVDT